MGKFINTNISAVGFNQLNGHYLQTPSFLVDSNINLNAHLNKIRSFLKEKILKAQEMGAPKESVFYIMISIFNIQTGKTNIYIGLKNLLKN